MNKEQIKELFEYKNGTLYWKVDRGSRKVKGKEAGYIHHTGYKQIVISGKMYSAHRLIWIYHNGEVQNVIDHINGNQLDNRIENLRDVTRSENQMNQKLRNDNSSGVKGVCWNKQVGKWMAQIGIGRKVKYLGYFDDLEFAELVVDEARQKYHGDFLRYA